MTYKEMHRIAIRLIEGGTEQIDGHFLKRCQNVSKDLPTSCEECELDSICSDLIMNICTECDNISNNIGHLVLNKG
jgi:hypothetical protein